MEDSNLTLLDVLCHPTYKRLITKSEEEIEYMRNVLLVYQLSDIVKNYYKTYKLTETLWGYSQQNFKHFKECPWTTSGGMEGPDTCICCHVKRNCFLIMNILNYIREYDGNHKSTNQCDLTQDVRNDTRQDTQFNFNAEMERLKTFEKWPVSFINPSDMVAAGFYYTNVGDRVRCAFCGVEIGQWIPSDIPLYEHKKFSPTCNFIIQKKNC